MRMCPSDVRCLIARAIPAASSGVTQGTSKASARRFTITRVGNEPVGGELEAVVYVTATAGEDGLLEVESTSGVVFEVVTRQPRMRRENTSVTKET